VRWIVALTLALSGCHGDPQQCEQACRNYGNLVYWKRADTEVAAVAPDQRDALRKKKLGELATRLEGHIDMCVSQCVAVDDTATVGCMSSAKTADQALACVK
jgi:hypothetical protein